MNLIIVITMCVVTFRQVAAHSPNCTWRGNYWSLQPGGEGQCSPCSACPIGKYMRARCTRTSDTKCARCRHGYFSLGGFKKRCKKCRKSVCVPGYRYVSCRRYRNAECKPCKKKHFYVEATRQCKRCNVCPPGHYVSKPCGIRNDNVCKPCPNGTYIETPGLHLYCLPCRFCGRGEETLNECKTDRNTKCGRCSPGYFRLMSSYECAKCSVCYREYPGYTVEVDECRRSDSDNDTICMPVLYPPYGHSDGQDYDYEVAVDDVVSRVAVLSGELKAVFGMIGVIILLILALAIFVLVLCIKRSRRKRLAVTNDSPLSKVHTKVLKWINEKTEMVTTLIKSYSEPDLQVYDHDNSKRNSYPTGSSRNGDPGHGHFSSNIQIAWSGEKGHDDFNMVSVSRDDVRSADMGSNKSDKTKADSTSTGRECNVTSDKQLVFIIEPHSESGSSNSGIRNQYQSTNYTHTGIPTTVDTGYVSSASSRRSSSSSYFLPNDQLCESNHRTGNDHIHSSQSNDALLERECSTVTEEVYAMLPLQTAVNSQTLSAREVTMPSSQPSSPSRSTSSECQIQLDVRYARKPEITVYSRNQDTIKVESVVVNPKSNLHNSCVRYRPDRDAILNERGEGRKCHSDPVGVNPSATQRSVEATLYHSESQVDSPPGEYLCTYMFSEHMREEQCKCISCKCNSCCVIQSL
ncbi:uncharacterized protein [Argopecten irradians]|uniref:uncharacterized protein isoform X2 n=1 Tax=Argopecten irradians TaxID=31199 RepID=UPI00371E43D7